MKGNHGSLKCCSHEKTTTVVGSHWKVIRTTSHDMENLLKDLHLYRSLVDAHGDFHTSFAVADSLCEFGLVALLSFLILIQIINI